MPANGGGSTRTPSKKELRLPVVLRLDPESGCWECCCVPLGVVTRHQESNKALEALVRTVDELIAVSRRVKRDPFLQSHRQPRWAEDAWQAASSAPLKPLTPGRLRGHATLAVGLIRVTLDDPLDLERVVLLGGLSAAGGKRA